MAEEVSAGEFQLRGRERLAILKMQNKERARIYLPLWPKGYRCRTHYVDGLGRFECWGRDGAQGKCCGLLEEEYDEHLCVPIMRWATAAAKDPKSGVVRLRLAKPLSYEVEMWRLGRDKYDRVLELNAKGKSLAEKDLELLCKEADYQKMDIDSLDDCVFALIKEKASDKATAIMDKVKEFYERMKKTVSRTVKEEELVEHIGGTAASGDAASEEDLSDIVEQ